MKRLSFCLAALFVAAGAWAGDYAFRLRNSLGQPRRGETVTIPVPQGTDLLHASLTDDAAATLPFEALGDTAIRFQAYIEAGTTRGYTLAAGTPSAPERKTYAAIKMPSTRADIAWENDLTAYRMYSATLLKNEPNTGNGVDLWVKKLATPVIDDMYGLANYHNESPYGVDAFSVNGRRLGVGGVTHVVDGHLVVHDPHDRCEIIESSPLRSAFRLTYNNVEVGGQTYTKTVEIETTAGSLLSRATVRYEGAPQTMRLAVALYQHTDMMGVAADGTAYTATDGLAGWAEGSSEGNVTSPEARFYQGCYVPTADSRAEVIDHHLCVTVDYTPGTDLVYYFGGGWNIFPEGTYTCDDDWFLALERFKKTIDSPLALTGWEGALPTKNDVIDVINRVNTHWQEANPTHGDHFWNRAVYHTGNMEAYRVTHDEAFLNYSLEWAEHNHWQGATGTDPSRWRYTYGETADYVLFGDNQVCFQVYADLYNLLGGEEKISRAREVMEYEMSTAYSGYWWWVDGFYMVMPVMTKLHNITHNPLYLDKMHEYWAWGTERMWDTDAHLYYRDTTYVYPQHTTHTGGKDFWARGDGWITAALPRVLAELPADDPHRADYIAIYLQLAEALRQCQCVDNDGNGYWCRSLLEENYAPGYETSGTALITYGLLWGIRNGLLDESLYAPVVQRAWKYLTRVALQADGTVGYVQPIGSNAAPGTYMRADQTSDFGVGAYLLAASEMSRYAAGEQTAAPLRLASARLTDCDRLTLVFNSQPQPEGVTDAQNYIVDGEPTQGTLDYDGDRTVLITLPRPMRYGRHTLSVRNLMSQTGDTIDATQVRTLLRTVPLYPNQTIKSVKAIGSQTGNPASNSVDNSLDTRWSQQGTAQWIQYDLGAARDIYAVDLAWYNGQGRTYYFDLQTSTDQSTWTPQLTAQASSGMTNEMERYYLTAPVAARYVRVVCNGSSASTWNSLTEARVCLVDSTLSDVALPQRTYTDILLPTATPGGAAITWRSLTPEVMTSSGIIAPTADEQTATLRAYTDREEQSFAILLPPRDADSTLQLRYDFETSDVYTSGSTRRLTDHSPHQRDAKLMGQRCTVDGTLNLTANTAAGFSSNGYVLLPAHVLDSLRSYTILFEATPAALADGPRFYDFGSGSGNSLFLRAAPLAAGYKLNGGATTLIPGPDLTAGTLQRIAVVFAAATHTTSVYVDGQCVAQSDDIAHEPYELTGVATDSRNYIGRTQWWSTASKAQNVDYQGTLDNFRLYALALTPEEIAAVFEQIQTAVVAPRAVTAPADIYNMSGQRVTRPSQKGVYVVGGRKIVK